MEIMKRVSCYLETFLKDIAGNEDFIYEVTSRDPKGRNLPQLLDLETCFLL